MLSSHRDRSWLYFCADPALMGFCIWGAPTEEEIDRLMRAIDVELTSPVHASLVDFSRLETVPTHGFAAMGGWLTKHAEVLRNQVSKQALVRPDGLVGSVIAGFYEVQPPVFPARVVASVEEALQWLGREDLTWLPQRLKDSAGELPEVAAIRAAVMAGEPSIAQVAKSLAMTERTLQRRLAEHGTSFRDQVLATRIDQAKTMLSQTDLPLGRIALDVGFSSQQHFNRAFKTLTGMLPSEYRKR